MNYLTRKREKRERESQEKERLEKIRQNTIEIEKKNSVAINYLNEQLNSILCENWNMEYFSWYCGSSIGDWFTVEAQFYNDETPWRNRKLEIWFRVGDRVLHVEGDFTGILDLEKWKGDVRP